MLKITAERLRQLILGLFIGLVFLTPLFWTPLNFELFEFNKMLLVYWLTVLIAASWGARMVTEKRVIWRKTPLFWPLVLFFASQLLATIFSIDRHTSIFGYYSRFHGGLLSTFCYLILFWALVSNGEARWRPKLIGAALFSGFLTACWGIAEHWGVDKNLWVQDVQNRVFSTLGQPNWLAAYLDILIFLLLGCLVNPKGKKKWHWLNYSLLAVYYLCLLYTKSRSGVLGLVAGGLVFWGGVIRKQKKTAGKAFLTTLAIIVFFSLTSGTPFTPSLFQLMKQGSLKMMKERGLGNEVVSEQLNITPSGEIRKIVWKGAVELWKRYPLLGTGVETFAYSYYWTRPAEHNLTSEWDFLYNKAHNEYLNFAATTGSVGLLTYLLLPLSFFFYFFRSRPKAADYSLPAALVTILVTNFFGFSVVVTGLWFFLLPALFFLPAKKRKESFGPVREGKQKLALWAVVWGAGWLSWQIIQYWRADFYFQQGVELEKRGQYHRSLFFHQKALAANGREPLYHSKTALTLANLAVATHQEKKASASAQLAKMAQEESDLALKISPYHLNFYRDRARLFYVLSQLDPSYLQKALETILRAIKLAPTDAKLYYNAGLVFYSLGEQKEGEEYLKKALLLKPNYTRAKEALVRQKR